MQLRTILLAVALGLFAAAPLRAQPGPVPGPAGPAPAPSLAGPPSGVIPPGTHALTQQDVQAWLDGYMPYALARGDVAGAVVEVVKDGRVLFQKGYGFADVATRTPVDPETTLFRPGSVSKLFTWTAVMQLVEQGRIGLDHDVNAYIDFTIPPYQGQPVTMRNLMTHTPGFEETVKDLIYAVPSPEPPLDTYLKQNLPARIFPPGKIPSYSNYGAALAGYIVQRASGETFDDYIEHHILAPLGMHHATFRQPLPADLRPFMSQGYEKASEPAKPFEIVGPAPAGSSSVSGADMAKFMIAHLQDGEYNGQRILQAATAQEMHRTRLNNIPPLNSMLLGFYQMNRNGHRIIGHGGDTQWFHSELTLFPDDDVGIFVSLNSLGADAAAAPIRQALREAFTDRYFPGPGPQGNLTGNAATAAAARLAGSYLTSRREETTFFSLLYYIMEGATVTAGADGDVSTPALKGLASQVLHFRPIAPNVWRSTTGKMRLAAKLDGNAVAGWTTDESPYEVYTPVPWYKNGAWLKPALIAAVIAFALTALFWPVNALYRRRYGSRLALQGNARLSYRLTRVASLLDALLIIAWFITIVVMFQTFALNGEFDGLIELWHVLSVIIFPLAALVLLWNVWVVWTTRRGWRSLFARGWSLVLALSGLLLLWAGAAFHLIGFGLKY